MSFSVKGYSGSDSDRPPNYWVVDESEVVVKDREIRSQRRDVHYQLSSPSTTRSHDDTVPLDDGHLHSTPTVSKTTQPLEVPGASKDDGELWASLDLILSNAGNTPTVHELGGPKTASHTTVVYCDAIVATVSTSLTPTAPPSSISIPPSGAIVSTDTTYAYGAHDLGHQSDHELSPASDSDDKDYEHKPDKFPRYCI